MKEDDVLIENILEKTGVTLKNEERAKAGKQLLKVSYKLNY